MRIIAACAVALMLAGCATKSPAATEQERIDAMAALDSCLHAAARKLDDGRSEASTIALVYGDQLSPLGSQIYHRMDDQVFIQVATAAVLDERAKRRQ